jgi:hypothetical protein
MEIILKEDIKLDNILSKKQYSKLKEISSIDLDEKIINIINDNFWKLI